MFYRESKFIVSLLSYLFFRKKTKDCTCAADTEHQHKVSESAQNANKVCLKDWKKTLKKEISFLLVMKFLWQISRNYWWLHVATMVAFEIHCALRSYVGPL
jgi:hypothetical protein